MQRSKWNFQEHMAANSNYMFEPTINIFDKSIVVCFQKVGTRFFLFLSNWPKTLSEVYNQYQINFGNNSEPEERLSVNLEFCKFNTSMHFLEEHKNSCYGYDAFLKNNNVNSMNEFFLENQKDMYFVIREPMSRFLTGITQVAGQYVGELIMQPEENERIKLLGELTDSEINQIHTNYNHYFNEHDEFTEENLSNVDVTIFTKIIIYIIKYKSYLYFYDAHTQNYLSKYKELIYNIKDKSKVKIIDLSDCKKESAYKLFNTWSDNVDYISAFNNTKGHVVSNKKLYNHLISEFNDSDDMMLQTLYYFLASEQKEYNELRNSKYFINL
jgi:hypothetical protein